MTELATITIPLITADEVRQWPEIEALTQRMVNTPALSGEAVREIERLVGNAAAVHRKYFGEAPVVAGVVTPVDEPEAP